MKKENTSPKIGDKVVVQTHYNGKKICTIDAKPFIREQKLNQLLY